MAESIIIDGCNVAECEFFDNGEVGNACKLGYWTDVMGYSSNCADNKNCMFKKLQAENEKLKKELDKYKRID